MVAMLKYVLFSIQMSLLNVYNILYFMVNG